MNSILNIELSCFANYDTPSNPKPINLLAWLKSEKYKRQVERIRSINDKTERDAIKATLPAITPSGLFTYRAAQNLIRHSGFIQFDIDLKGNESIENFQELKAQVSRIRNVAYCGLSVSGAGFWGLIPIADCNKHNEHHKAIQVAFAKLGITIDPAPKSVASLRGYSFDSSPYFNHHASVFSSIDAPHKVTKHENKISDSFANVQKFFDTAAKMISEAKDGQKWHQLSKASYLLGGYAAGGLVDATESLRFLKAKIEQRGDVASLAHAFKTIEKSFAEGMKKPIYN